MFIGFILLLAAAYFTLGGFDYLQANVPPTHFTATGGNSIDYIAFWYIVALVTLVEPTFYQRCFAAKSVSVARRGIFISIGFWLFFDFMTTFCGLYARALLPDLADPVSAFPALAAQILPIGLTGIFLLSLLATIMSTVDSYMFLAATTISHDLVWRFKRFEEHLIKRVTALGLAITSIGTIAIAVVSDSVINIWHDFGSVATAALLLPLVTSYWGRFYYSRRGAMWAIISSALVTVIALLYPSLSGTGSYLLGIEPIFIGLAVSALILAISRTRKALI
jgi:SSS family solute:Na+ symporter